MSTAPRTTTPASRADSQPALGLAPPVGLSSADAERRLAEFGRNELRRERSTAALTLLARQFASPVIWLLVGRQRTVCGTRRSHRRRRDRRHRARQCRHRVLPGTPGRAGGHGAAVDDGAAGASDARRAQHDGDRRPRCPRRSPRARGRRRRRRRRATAHRARADDERSILDGRKRTGGEGRLADGGGHATRRAPRLRLHGDLRHDGDRTRRGRGHGNADRTREDRPLAGDGRGNSHASPAATGEGEPDPAVHLRWHRRRRGIRGTATRLAAHAGVHGGRLAGRRCGAGGAARSRHDRARGRRATHGRAECARATVASG